MNTIRKYAGIVWILLGPVSLYFLVKTALAEIEHKPLIDTKIQWIVFVVIFIPIVVGMVIFGYYALKGEFDEKA